jgi:hypothetical protein
MTATEVVATLASPLNAFKIVNTGDPIGAFTEDRDSAIRGVLGAEPHMIPVHITVHESGVDRKVNVEVLDLPSLTPRPSSSRFMKRCSRPTKAPAETSYHLTGSILLDGNPPSPLDLWASAGEANPAPMDHRLPGRRALQPPLLQWRTAGHSAPDRSARRGHSRHIMRVDLETARLISSDNIVHAGDTVVVEAPSVPGSSRRAMCAFRFTVPARLGRGQSAPFDFRCRYAGPDTGPAPLFRPPADLETVLAQARHQHPADRIYVSLLVPESQAGMDGQTLASLPLSVANALEPLRATQDVNLNGESAQVAGEALRRRGPQRIPDTQSAH